MNRIDKLIRTAIKESMGEKAEELHSMIQDEDWNPNGPVTISAQSTDISEDDEFNDEDVDIMDMTSSDNEETCKYHMDNFGPDDERTQMFCKGTMTEALKGKQKKLDKNKNGKLDKQDFKLLRKSKVRKEVEEIDLSKLEKGRKYSYKSPSFEDEIEYTGESDELYNPMHSFRGQKASHLMGDKDVESFVSDFEDDEIGVEDVPLRKRRPVGDIEDIEFEDMTPENKRKSFFGKMKRKMGFGEAETEEGNAFTGALAKTKKGGKFKVGGKTYTDKSNLDEFFNYDSEDLSDNEPTYVGRGLKDNKIKDDMKNKMYGSFSDIHGWYDDSDREFRGEFEDDYDEETFDDFKTFNKKYAGKQRWFSPGKQGEQFFNKYKEKYGGPFRVRKSKLGESIELTESEMIDLIEQIVLEQKSDKSFGGKKPKGMAETEKAQKGSKKENDDYIKSVTKKFKDYLKDASKGSYETNPKHFPKGNGELAKMEKMTYQADTPTSEYIENFTAAGQENLVYDEIHPDEKWVDDNIEGSSRTGNNSEWANAVDTGVNKKRNQIRKDNLLGAVKDLAYNKSPQPAEIVNSGESVEGRAGKFKKNFGKDAAIKATKILNQLESTDSKNEKLLSEEFDKMKNLMNYNKTTQ
jgi:hypothetical protein